MVDPFLQACLDEPLKDAKRINNIFLPGGRKSADTRTEDEKKLANANGRIKRENNKARLSDKRSSLLDYYASTAIPFDRIAQHLGINVDDVRIEMKRRGRVA